MYSVVLMMAMTSGAEVPDFGHHRRNGCCGAPAACCGAPAPTCAAPPPPPPAPVCGGCAGGCDCGGCACAGRRHRLFHRHRNGCCGAPVTCCAVAVAPPACAGCAGGGPAMGPAPMMGPYQEPVPTPSGAKPMPGKTPEKVPAPKTPKVMLETPTNVVVTTPANAQLTADAVATTSDVYYVAQDRPRFRLFGR